MMPRRHSMRTLAASAVMVTALVLAGFSGTPALAAVSPNKPSSADLVEQPKVWDGKAVTFRGEAIAEAMVRGDMAWLHLNDDGYHLENVEEGSGLQGYNSGMPVWLPAGLAGQVETFGDYKHQGEVVEVRGIFNAACAVHGGDMDIHATELRRVLAGRRVNYRVHPWKIAVAIALSLLAAALWLASRNATGSFARGAVTRWRS